MKKKPNEQDAQKRKDAQAGEAPQETDTAPQEAPDAPEEVQQPDAPTLLELLNAAEDKRDEYLATAQRVQAEFDNYRRRNQNLYKDAYNDGVRDALLKFIGVLDNLERAAQADGDAKAVREGVNLVLKQFLGVMEGLGVEEICAEGEFDPEFHNAVMREEHEGESNQILQVLQKGYKMGDKVLRYSMVKVSG